MADQRALARRVGVEPERETYDHLNMSDSTQLAPGVPEDYYRRIKAAESRNFWYRGMWKTAAGLLGPRLERGGRVLDAGCGTGGFLRLLLDEGRFDAAAGVDIAGAAVSLAREQAPEADIRQAPLRELPFEDASFELVVSNDVLQHVPESDVASSLAELRRVLSADGALLLRTNGARVLRRERDDWRAYDAATLRAALAGAGFRIDRLTHANTTLSLYAAARGRTPRAPSEESDGIPVRTPGTIVSAVGSAVLSLEARWVTLGGSLPYGYTLFALARRG